MWSAALSRAVCRAAIHNIMLNSYDSYLPNVTLDQTSTYLSATSPQNSLLLFGNGGNSGINGAGTPSFPNGNYIYVSASSQQRCDAPGLRMAALKCWITCYFVTGVWIGQHGPHAGQPLFSLS